MQNRLLTYLSVFLLIISMAGCYETSQELISRSPEENQTFPKATEGRYLIDCTDVLNITVFDVPDLSLSIRVSGEGILSYPLIGDIMVKGLTTEEVEKILEERLSDGYLKKPDVTIRFDLELMAQYKEKEVYVLGEVKNPGTVPILGKYLTVLEAVTKAGGFAEFAAPNRTKVIRVEDGVEKTIMVDLNKVKDGNKSLDIILKVGDVIVVPESFL